MLNNPRSPPSLTNVTLALPGVASFALPAWLDFLKPRPLGMETHLRLDENRGQRQPLNPCETQVKHSPWSKVAAIWGEIAVIKQ